ncbi:spore coat protein GerQ [Metabacillus halosaccharovorans]|uniref:Spore coat protein GerQ n=1 Tax=Metabacillus halosaccharovorans TaxID=930124 RepID=A0ABT3DFA0_9BACI|nr:spore coat protein GerQ [Metabacillus halosaccharovorans]MCV9885755.1 spore coat protein GerQ [Metabacillus halosaccharovorans]
MNQNQQYGYPMQGMQQGAGYQQPYPTYAYPSPYGQYGQNGVQPPQILPQQQQQGVAQNIPGMLPLEQSYVENILRLNRGKVATVYMTFEGNREWNAKIFKGVVEAAGRDHLILSDPQTGKRFLLLMVYLDYVTFDEELNYDPQFTLPAAPPR